ncbi:hypothetical protein [Helicobacter pylori]|uniref:hypothetical protein n=1 Tax=Helicobacter pylori TaxID=210 RepID=UPI000982251C|nr:hypothetical protein [Helicobacter pylori]AQM65840.1 hypothetical protein HPYLSS1_00909 [Helicobacter pylori SS1]AQM72386.1 hypothetical protein HPYLPMSS1_00909 [Helicobacter pylori PMSS1]OWT35098.1 hypothetical protein X567_04100 [Helicobacter pylori PMSS1]PNW31489.1 hypothetical protein X570_03375 [Helicobacter pylori Iso8]PNW33823.1 hypothetical protein X569_03010 [Helicobacter pylori Iso6]
MPLKSSHESLKNEKALRKIEAIGTLFNHYRNGNSVSNLNRNNPTTNEFKTQEPQRMKQKKCTIVKSMLEIIKSLK